MASKTESGSVEGNSKDAPAADLLNQQDEQSTVENPPAPSEGTAENQVKDDPEALEPELASNEASQGAAPVPEATPVDTAIAEQSKAAVDEPKDSLIIQVEYKGTKKLIEPVTRTNLRINAVTDIVCKSQAIKRQAISNIKQLAKMQASKDILVIL